MSREKRFATPSRLAGLRLGWRLARRTTLRGLRRSILIIALIAVPLAGTTAVLTVFQSTAPTTEERIATSLGGAEAILWAFTPPGSDLRQEPLEPFSASSGNISAEARILDISDVVPRGTEVLTLEWSSVLAETPHGRTRVEVLRGPSWDPVFEGMHQLEVGRDPRRSDEAVVTRSVLERFDIDLGDEISVVWPGPAMLTVVGVMGDRTLPDSSLTLYVPTNTTVPSDEVGRAPLQKRHFLPELALSWSDVQTLNTQGYVALSRSVLLSPPPDAQPFFKQSSADSLLLAGSVIGIVFAALEVILLAGAAFSVTARQEQRTLALLASTGASPGRLGRLLAFRGVLLGFLGGVAGVGLGLGLAAGFIAWDSNGSATQYYGFHVPVLYLTLFVVAATVLGWLAALVPGRTIARMDVVGALRGSRRPPPPSKRTPRFGLAFIAIGTLVLGGVVVATPLVYDAYRRGLLTELLQLPYLEGTLVALFGAVMLLLGLGLSVSFLLRVLASAFRRAGFSTRLALSDASRNSPRTAPAVAVTLTVTFVASLGMCMLGAMQAQMMSGYVQTSPTGTIYFSLTQQDVLSEEGNGVETRRFTDTSAIREILEANVDLTAMSAIWSTDTLNPGTGLISEDAGGDLVAKPYVAVDIPPDQLCPSDRRSPEWTPDHLVLGTDAYATWNSDPRCVRTTSSRLGLGDVQVSNETGLALILGHQPTPATLEAFRSGKAIVLDPLLLDDGTVSISWWPPDSGGMPPFLVPDGVTPIRTQTVDAHSVDPGYDGEFSVIVSRATAEKLGLDSSPTVVLARSGSPVSYEQLIALQESALALPGNTWGQLDPQVEQGPGSRLAEQGIAMVAIVGLSAFIALAATAIAIGLARVDAARDLATLRAVGASPALRRRLSFAQALIIAGIGTVLGTLLGIAPAAVIGQVLEMPFSPPWLHLAMLVIGVPLLIATGSALIQRRVRDTSVRL